MKNFSFIGASTLLIAALTIVFVMPATAQHDEHHESDTAVAGGGEFPEGWEARTDRDQPVDDLVFTTMGDGFHATTGPAAVFYNSDWAHSDDYEVSARFTQTESPENPESYGIIIGGSDLSGPDQAYSYFLVRKTGEYFIATREGDERSVIVDWTDHEAVQAEDESGRQENVLGARVEEDDVVFTVNGTEVDRRQKGEILADGLFGFRINHRLDIDIHQVQQ